MKTSLIKLFHSLGRKQAAKAMSKREGITQIPDVITSQGEGAAVYTTLREAGLTDDALAKLINSEQDIVRLLNRVESMRNQILPKQGSGIASLETGTERYNKLTGLDKSKPFMGWTPKVVPKAVNIPASKINHQMIADKYGIDVELIRGKDWVEVLEVIRKLGLKHGGLAEILQAPRSGYAQGIGPVGEGKSFPTNSKMPVMDPYKLFFMFQNKLMRDKKKEGLARILEV